MILRLRTKNVEITITKKEREQLDKMLLRGVDVIKIRGYTIMRGDIAHIDPTGLSNEELVEREKHALPAPAHERASSDKVASIRAELEKKGIVKGRTK